MKFFSFTHQPYANESGNMQMSTCDSWAVGKYFIRGEGIVKVFNHNVNDSYGKKINSFLSSKHESEAKSTRRDSRC